MGIKTTKYDEARLDEVIQPTGRINRGIRQAALAARLSDGKQRVGAAVFVGSKCVSTASNSMKKTHPKACDHYEWPFPHAEWNALNGLSKQYDLSQATVYIARILHTGDIAQSKPCCECYKVLRDSGLKAVYYTEDPDTVRKVTF